MGRVLLTPFGSGRIARENLPDKVILFGDPFLRLLGAFCAFLRITGGSPRSKKPRDFTGFLWCGYRDSNLGERFLESDGFSPFSYLDTMFLDTSIISASLSWLQFNFFRAFRILDPKPFF